MRRVIYKADGANTERVFKGDIEEPIPDEYATQVALLDAAADEEGDAYIAEIGSRIYFRNYPISIEYFIYPNE